MLPTGKLLTLQLLGFSASDSSRSGLQGQSTATSVSLDTVESSHNTMAGVNGDMDLSAARKHMKEEGWCVVDNVLSEAQTKEARDRLWAAVEESKKRGDDTFLSWLDPNESNIRVFYLMELDKIFRDLISHPLAIQMVKSVLGDNFLISNFTANIARPGSKSMGLHSDQSLVSPDPWLTINALNVIWCLNDCYFENGATLFIPGSNKWERRNDIPANAKQLLKPFTAKAGSFIVMDGRVWHTSGANITKDEDRALLFGYYTAPHLRQQVNWAKKMSEETQKTLSPEMYEWLGLNINANLGEAILHLKYLDEQFPEAEGKTKTSVSTAEKFAKSSNNK